MTLSKEELQEMARSVSWFHSMDLGQGVVTRGLKSSEQLDHELRSLRLPDLAGKSVLDIGAWDGYFSFAAEVLGARRVVALDHYVWSMDLHEHFRYVEECKTRGIVPRLYHEMNYWRPSELPGKRGFDTAHRAFGSRVEERVADFMEMDLAALGVFDVVLYLGALYHMEDPLRALRRVAAVTEELAVIETDAAALPGYEHQPICLFFPSNELDNDVSNWWAPNQKALEGMCRAAGFRKVEALSGSPFASPQKPALTSEIVRYRAVVHAWK